MPPKVAMESTIKKSQIIYHEQIGHGASGEVYKVTLKSKKHVNRIAAAKKINIFGIENFEDKFGSEINYLQTLSHENIITYYGHVVTKSHLVIVTEYAAKGSLHDILKGKTSLPPDLKLKWATQAAQGIKYLQERGVLHRDIKSPNCLITADDDLKICDVGIAKDLTSTKSTETSKGSIRWLAPEAFNFTGKSHLSPKSDIFAFGVVLWELETCEEPYKGMRAERVMWVVGNDGSRPEIPANCHPILRELIQCCWDTSRQKRPEVDGILQQLELYERSILLDSNKALTPTTGLKWHHKHTIAGKEYVNALLWVSNQHLAVCMAGCVRVYEVTPESSHLAYQLTSEEWRGFTSVAVTESIPDHMLVVSYGRPYVYQYPCHAARQPVKKYKIRYNWVNTFPIIDANASTAVVASFKSLKLSIFSLSDFKHQSIVQINVSPWKLSISTDYLLIMGDTDEEIVVKPLSDLSQDLCRIKVPDRKVRFQGMSIINNASEIYVACEQDGAVSVYKYVRSSGSSPSYSNAGIVIPQVGGQSRWAKGLAMKSDGSCLAIEGPSELGIKIYNYGE